MGLSSLITLCITLMGAVPLTWFMAGKAMRRRSTAEAKGAEISNEGKELDNAKKVVDLFEKLAQGQNVEIAKLRQEVKEVKKEMFIIKLSACYDMECKDRKSRK